MKKLSNPGRCARFAATLCFSATLLLASCGGGGGSAAPRLAADTTAQDGVTVSTEPGSGIAPTSPIPAPTPVLPSPVQPTPVPPATPAPPPPAPPAPPPPAPPPPPPPATPGSQFALTGYQHNPLDTGAPASRSFYVAPNGVDTAKGTEAAPFRTLERATRAASQPGTTVWVAPGTYAGGFQSTASGAPSARIAYVSTTRWGARVVPDPSSNIRVGWDNRGAHVSIIGFEVDGGGEGAWSHGIYTGGSYSLIQENHVHHIANVNSCDRIGGSAIGADSYFRGIEQDVIANTVHDIGPAHCKFIQGIYMSTTGRVMNNLVYRVGEAAIHLWHDASDVIVANNTVAASGFGIIVGGGNFYFTSAGNDRTSVLNNLVYGNGLGISEQGKTGMSNRYLNNLVFHNDEAISLKNGLKAVATLAVDPLFAAYAPRASLPDFRLGAGSPAIGSGRTPQAPPRDIDGKLRAGSIDIGAYAY
jgi:hypothetical protein